MERAKGVKLVGILLVLILAFPLSAEAERNRKRKGKKRNVDKCSETYNLENKTSPGRNRMKWVVAGLGALGGAGALVYSQLSEDEEKKSHAQFEPNQPLKNDGKFQMAKHPIIPIEGLNEITGSPSRILLVGEIHHTPQSDRQRDRLDALAQANKITLAKEGETSDSKGRGDHVVGIEERYVYALTGVVTGNELLSAGSFDKYTVNLLIGAAIAQPESLKRVKPKLERLTYLDPGLKQFANVLEGVAHSASTGPPKIKKSELEFLSSRDSLPRWKYLVKELSNELVEKADTPAFQEKYHIDTQRVRAILSGENQNPTAFSDFNLQVRERYLAKAIANAYKKAAARGEDLYVIIGAAHTPGIQNVLRRSFDAAGGEEVKIGVARNTMPTELSRPNGTYRKSLHDHIKGMKHLDSVFGR